MGNEAHDEGIEAVISAFPLGAFDKKDVEAAIKAYLDASDLVLVPREPTKQMLQETSEIVTHVYGGDYNGYMDEDTAGAAYACMISAAPNPFESKQDE